MKIALAVVLGLGALVGIAAIFPTGGECGGYGIGPFGNEATELFVTFGGEPTGYETIAQAGEAYLSSPPIPTSIPPEHEGRVVDGDYAAYIDDELIVRVKVQTNSSGAFYGTGHVTCLTNLEAAWGR